MADILLRKKAKLEKCLGALAPADAATCSGGNSAAATKAAATATKAATTNAGLSAACATVKKNAEAAGLPANQVKTAVNQCNSAAGLTADTAGNYKHTHYVPCMSMCVCVCVCVCVCAADIKLLRFYSYPLLKCLDPSVEATGGSGSMTGVCAMQQKTCAANCATTKKAMAAQLSGQQLEAATAPCAAACKNALDTMKKMGQCRRRDRRDQSQDGRRNRRDICTDALVRTLYNPLSPDVLFNSVVFCFMGGVQFTGVFCHTHTVQCWECSAN